MPEKKRSTSKEKPSAPKPLPPGCIPIDSAHFRRIPIIGIIDCTK